MSYVLDLHEVDRTQIARVGGKGAMLGELSRIPGVRVPPGFCVTTDALQGVAAVAPSFGACLDRLSAVELDDREAIRALSADLRQVIDASVTPDELAGAITSRLREGAAYAVRSSATAEDSPGASFAGQHDTYLDVVGPAAVLEQVIRCWASLFTERAVTYRLRAGLDPRTARMAVVVQEMVVAQAAGVLFTADPLRGNRRVSLIEATWGLGDGLVSGTVMPEALEVLDGRVVARSLASEPDAIHAHAGGGPSTLEADERQREQPILTDEQAVQLAELGRQIEAHLGRPQDIEWCLSDDGFAIVQSRPITTLFPIPQAHDDAPHVYISVGHQQMMTYAMKPLGISLWQHTTPRLMGEAGSRLFVDVTRLLASPTNRGAVIGAFTQFDPLIGGALQEVVDRGFVPPSCDDDTTLPPGIAPVAQLDADPAIVCELIARGRASVAQTTEEIAGKSGAALVEAIVADIERSKAEAFKARGLHVIKVAMDAAAWLNEHIEQWLGEPSVADVLTRSAERNVTSEMGLALLDVADAFRPHQDVISFLEQVEEDGFDDQRFLDALAGLPGGSEARDALAFFLERYGMRCVGEIDVTRPRWSEQPTALVPAILTNVKTFAPGEAKRRFEHGRREAQAKRDDILERLRALPDGARRADETAAMIDRVRAFAGYREHPKYTMVTRYFVYKQALMGEADRLVDARVLQDREDIFFLRLEELPGVLRDQRVDQELLRSRKRLFREHETLMPPRVLTSDGEMLSGTYGRQQLPPGALPGLAVSTGVAEGRARVAFDIRSADLRPGDILVTSFTDPSWTPVLLAAGALVTEVGGLMTHGAVIAREYGLPAVVGVERATELIRDEQRIRVHGGDGYVELLP